MQIPTIDRLKLLHELWERSLSDVVIEAVVQNIEYIRKNQGHSAAESKAKEIRLLIETGITESELLKQLKQMN